MICLRRRAILGAALALPFAARGQSSCGPATAEDVEGPFYKAGAPLRASLAEPGAKAEKLILTGTVRSTDCKPLAKVLLDFWHADASGAYDNRGYRYRGVVLTDAEGRYRLETNLPPPYSGRPRHIHVKLTRPGGATLTTQLYFPGESGSADRLLVVKLDRRQGGLSASYDFAV